MHLNTIFVCKENISMKSHSFIISLSLLSAVCIMNSSCGGDNAATDTKKDTLSNNVSAKDMMYIQIADASNFLPSWSKENILVYHEIGEPDDMHPTNGSSAARFDIMVNTQVYVVGTDYRNLTIRPIAVKSLPQVSANELEFTYELRNDITFDDGSPISVDDIIFTYKANKCPLTNNPHAKSYLENLVEIKADPTKPGTFTVVMKEKYIQNITFMADYPIMQRSFFDKNNVLAKYSFAQFNDPNFKADKNKDLADWAAEFNSAKYGREVGNLVGAGPYKIEKWDAGQSITLVKKANHWSDKSNNAFETSYPQKIIFKLNKDANSQILEFKSQTMDVSTNMSTKTLLELQADPKFNENYNSRFTDTYNYGYVAMNMKPDGIKHKKIFVDKRVRRAMALLTPLDNINKVLNKSKNKRTVGPVSYLKPEYNSDLKLIPFDIEAAKKLLDEAGWKDTDGDNIRDKMVDGEKIKLEFNVNYMTTQIEWKNMAEMMAEQMYKAGVKANLNPVDFSVLVETARNHDFDMMLASWAGNFAPEDYTQLWHTSAWASKGSNYTGFGNAESDALIDSIKHSIDDAKRIPLIKRFQEIVYDEQPYIFMFSSLRRNVIHKRFGNQEMYFERPGVWLGNLKLISNAGASAKPSSVY